MSNQIVYDLVENTDTPIPVRLDGLSVAAFSSITMRITRADRSKITLAVTPDGTDDELVTVNRSLTSLPRGDHKAEMRLIRASDGAIGRVPRADYILLKVRPDQG